VTLIAKSGEKNNLMINNLSKWQQIQATNYE